MSIIDALIEEARADATRPWWKRSTGGQLVAIVLLALAGQLLLAGLWN